MGGPNTTFANLPAYRNLVRGLTTQKVTVFRGLNIFTSFPNLGPESALQLLNCIVQGSGALSKLRYPTLILNVGAGPGPSRIFDFQQGSGARQMIVVLGTTIYIFDINDNNNLLFQNSSPNHSTVIKTSIITCNNIAFMANGAEMVKWTGTALQNWGIQVPVTAPVLGAPAGGGALTFTQGGRMYGYSYGNSVTGHIGSMSPASIPTGNLVNNKQPVTAAGPAPADAQVDTLYWWSTLDGGSDFYLNTSGPIAGLLNYVDNILDSALNVAVQASFINDPPPIGDFLQKFQGRMFIFNINGAPQDIVYSGYERIFIGRPEESFPPFNRLKLATGADQIFGGGVIQAGVIAFSRTNQMFMFRGVVEDIVVNAPLLYSAYLEELPWALGCIGHPSIASTPYGLVWVGSDLSVMIYNGIDKPVILSNAVTAMLRASTPAPANIRFNMRGVYFNWLDREWYVLSFAYNGSLVNNRILFFDLNPNPESNAGVWVSDIEADDIGVVEDQNGRRRLCITNNGNVYEVYVEGDTSSGITLTPVPAPTINLLTAYWQSGYFGNENPQTRKMMRWGSVFSDFANSMPSPSLYLIDDDQGYTFKNPLIKVLPFDGKSKATTNIKGRRASYLINFPSADNSYNILELVHNHRETGDV